MKKSSGMFKFCAVVALVLTLSAAPALTQKGTSTAQSAMFENSAAGTFVITGNEVWAFDANTAKTYFTNTLSSGPTVTCAGNPTNCAPGNKPAAPSAPLPDAQKLTPVASQNSCTFFDGGTLVVNSPHDSYTQSVTINGLNGSGNWKFEWTYTVAVGATNPVDARTAWVLQDSSTSSAEVTVSGFFAGQSTQKKNSGKSDWSFKASHTMTDEFGNPRLLNPLATILDENADTVCTLTISTALESGVDFNYLGNAGSNGDTGQLINNALVSAIQQGLISSPNGNTDNFSGNDGANGDRANITSTSPATCSIANAGNYTLKVTATLKGVAGSSSLPLSISSNLCISAGTCSVCQ